MCGCHVNVDDAQAKSIILGMKWDFKDRNLHIFGLKLNKYNKFKWDNGKRIKHYPSPADELPLPLHAMTQLLIFNPLSPHDALKHHFASLKTYLIFLQPRVLERKFPPHPIIFIHYKSRIATAIRGLWWMKMTMVNSGLKGLIGIGAMLWHP